jgi:hypothetical protein
MSIPKPQPPKPKAPTPVEKTPVSPVGEPVSPRVKPPFVMKPHLTERPLRNHEGLSKLRDSMQSKTIKRDKRK